MAAVGVGGGARINTPAGQDGSSRRGGEEALDTKCHAPGVTLPASHTAGGEVGGAASAEQAREREEQ